LPFYNEEVADVYDVFPVDDMDAYVKRLMPFDVGAVQVESS
jgi:hypothetical protein